MESSNLKDEISIIAENITKRFHSLVAIRDFNLQVYKGESFALLGPDGAGKTTAMRIICGILPANSGNISINGINVSENADKASKIIGYMPQRFSLYENLSVLQNINFFSDLYHIDKTTRQKRIDQYLEFTRLKPFAKRLAGHLSGGMRQKLALICSIIHNPPILLLDEPTTGVDPVSRRDFWKILYRLLAEGLTLLISTPYMDEAERCSRIGLMHNGEMLLVNTPDELKKQMNNEIMEIKCDNPRLVGDLLRLNEFIISIQTFSDKIHMILKENANGQDIIPYLKSNGLDPSKLHKVKPNIEDVFISRLMK